MPSADTAGFHAEARALWRAIHGDSPPLARPAFFPEAAYVRLKAIGDPRDDYTNRLLEDYALDIRTAHQLLGAEAAAARLVGVQVPSAHADWVPVGTCENDVGYYEVPNSRVL